MDYDIRELSRITQLPVTTIRSYQDEGLLTPARRDPASGNEYYDAGVVERARVVRKLRNLDYSLAQMRELLAGGESDRPAADGDTRGATAARKALRAIVLHERETEARARTIGESVVERSFDSQVIGGVRLRARPADIVELTGPVMERFGRWASGGPLALYHEMDYRDDEADCEVCVPLRRAPPAGQETRGGPAGEAGEWSVRVLPARRCLVTLHRGPLEEIGRSYARLLDRARQAGSSVTLPIEELSLRGPGMLVPPSPRRYLTEIRIGLH